MSRAKVIYRCEACGAASATWVGRCPACQAWSTLVEARPVRAVVAAGSGTGSSPRPITDVGSDGWACEPTRLPELDRVLGGGLVRGSVSLLGGEPGIGKSTLLLQLAAARARNGERVLYVSAEESASQVRLRAERLGAVVDDLWLVAAGAVPEAIAHVDELRPDLLLVDSIQTVHDPEVGSAPGSVAQVRACADRLVREAKARDRTTVLVGHVTKDGSLAGPRALEHLVDTVLSFEGDGNHSLRFLRATKHRFGDTEQLGVLEMAAEGLRPVGDPSRLFLADRRPDVPGSVVATVLEGYRPLLVEVQALVVQAGSPPVRAVQGLDRGRLEMVLAVLERRIDLRVAGLGVHALAAGGVRATEPGVDLALALAVVSSLADRALPSDLVVCGEVGLGGELRQVQHAGRRLAEAARLGYRRALVPRSCREVPGDVEVAHAGTLGEAIALAGLPLP